MVKQKKVCQLRALQYEGRGLRDATARVMGGQPPQEDRSIVEQGSVQENGSTGQQGGSQLQRRLTLPRAPSHTIQPIDKNGSALVDLCWSTSCDRKKSRGGGKGSREN